MELDAFCRRYNIDRSIIRKAGLEWDELLEISNDYSRYAPQLEAAAKATVQSLLTCEQVHAVNYRIKAPEHLVEKIIRKCAADPSRCISLENYRTEITDLLGVRVLHLFKEDWIGIHQFITDSWGLVERPIAYMRPGDPENMIAFYRENACTVREHKYGYRSVHYLVRSGEPGLSVEIQSRTLFEEAWGEIDHLVRYPYQMDNELLVRLSSILNRLAGNADELGSYMRYLKRRMDTIESRHDRELREKNELIASLRRKIDLLEIDSEKKREIASGLSELEASRQSGSDWDPELPWLQSFIESDLFKDITTQIDRFVKSEHFKPIEITDSDIAVLEKTQEELVNLMRNPEHMYRLLHSMPVGRMLTQNGADPAGTAAPETGSGAPLPADRGTDRERSDRT